MSYLRFDKTLMTNLGESLPKEILRTTVQGLTIVQPLLIAIRENIMDCLSFRCLNWMMKTVYCYRRWMKQ